MTAGRPDDERFAEAAGHRLRLSAAGLDPAIVEALDRARGRAVAAAREPGFTAAAWRPLPLAAAASLAGLAAVAGWALLRVPATLPGMVDSNQAADMEIVLAGDNLEMLEDLEFYAWLTDQPDAG